HSPVDRRREHGCPTGRATTRPRRAFEADGAVRFQVSSKGHLATTNDCCQLRPWSQYPLKRRSKNSVASCSENRSNSWASTVGRGSQRRNSSHETATADISILPLTNGRPGTDRQRTERT